MRKCFSNLVMAAMLLMAISPLLALAPQALPACCRSGGAHHCSAMPHRSGEGVRAEAPQCPYPHRAAVVPSHLGLPGPRTGLAITTIFDALQVAQSRPVAGRSAYSIPQRGPPLS